MEIIIVCGLIVFICFYNKTIDGKKFIADNEKFFQLLREKDYDFLVFSKYGDDADCDELFKKRVNHRLDKEVKKAVIGCRNALAVLVCCLFAAGVIVAFILTILYKNYVKPLNSYTNQLIKREELTKEQMSEQAEDDFKLRIHPSGATELREFGRIYNRLSSILSLEIKKSNDACIKMKKAKEEYRKYQEITLSPVEEEYLKSIKGISKEVKKRKKNIR